MRLASYIHIDEYRFSRQRIIPYRIRFELDRDCLSRIDAVRKNRQSIQLESDRLTNIRYYALLVFYAQDDSELVFITNYLQDSHSTAVIKSAIAATGKISQQILADSLNDSQLFNRIIKAHHWSISQIITQLPLKSHRFSKWLSAIISLLMTVLISPLIIYGLLIIYWIKILIIFIIFIVLYLLFEHLLISRIKKLILNQLLFGWLGQSVEKRQIGLTLLSILQGSFQ